MKLEVGKIYKTRSKDRLVRIVNYYEPKGSYEGTLMDSDSSMWYSDDGKALHCRNFDIIEEYKTVDLGEIKKINDRNKIKLEVGKTYLTRDGDKVIIDRLVANAMYPIKGIVKGYDGGGDWNVDYKSDGLFIGDLNEHSFDIVSEFVESKQEQGSNTMNQEQQKPLFEVGKTYKDGYDRDVKILARIKDVLYPLVGQVGGMEGYSAFDENGKSLSGELNSKFSLIPPEQPLPIVIGGFYLDNHGIVRILINSLNSERCNALSLSDVKNINYIIPKDSFPNHMNNEFKLVKLLSHEEAQELIRKASI